MYILTAFHKYRPLFWRKKENRVEFTIHYNSITCKATNRKYKIAKLYQRQRCKLVHGRRKENLFHDYIERIDKSHNMEYNEIMERDEYNNCA